MCGYSITLSCFSGPVKENGFTVLLPLHPGRCVSTAASPNPTKDMDGASSTEWLYNNLPSIDGEADERFANRNVAFAPILAKFNHQFGVCLVRAHCELKHGSR